MNGNWTNIRILSVGQCGPDNWRLARAVKRIVDAEFDTASTSREALDFLARSHVDLVLVNRLFDADGTEGVQFITAARAVGHTVPIMLVSDYDDAQEEAVAAGASRGFGKSELHDPEMETKLRDALERRPAQPQ